MRKTHIAGAVIAASLLAASAASATTFDWSFTNSSDVVVASGQLTTGAADLGGLDVETLTGSVNDATVGIDGSITSFAPGSGSVYPGFTWDNVVYTTAPHVDNFGLLFNVGSTQINIFNNTGSSSAVVYPGGYPGGDGVLSFDGATFSTEDNGTFNLSVPEPATWAVMLLGFGGIGAAVRHKRRRQVAAA